MDVSNAIQDLILTALLTMSKEFVLHVKELIQVDTISKITFTFFQLFLRVILHQLKKEKILK